MVGPKLKYWDPQKVQEIIHNPLLDKYPNCNVIWYGRNGFSVNTCRLIGYSAA